MYKLREIIFNFLYKKINLGLAEVNVFTIILFIYGITLFFFSIFSSSLFLKLNGLFFILLGSLFHGLIGGVITFGWFCLIVVVFYFFHGTVFVSFGVVNIIGSYLLIFVVVGKVVDIFKRQQEELEKSKNLLERTQSLTGVGGWEYKVEEDKMYWTKELFNLHGFSENEEINYIEKSLECYPDKAQKKIKTVFKEAVKEGKVYDLEVPFINAKGEKLWVRTVGKPITKKGKVVKVVGNLINITEQKEKEERLKYLSYHDHLTDLYNRRYLEEKINSMDMEKRLPISLIIADINGLRLINDTYGYEKGDEMLIKTAELLTNFVREEDIVIRWAGDSFVILLPNTTEKKTEKVYNKIKKQFIESKEGIPVSLGMGMAVKEEADQDIYYILNKAEENMHQDKLTERRSIKSNLVKSLINTLVAKSQETKEHTLRMVDYALKLGKRIELSTPELNDLSLVAMLHDIGKTSVSEEILNKPEKLTEEEWEEIKKHPQYGYNIASATEEISHVAKEIRSHHEWWDGSGYPRRLKGEEIPLLARIVSIVDAYDVMMHERPYKEKYAKEYAIKELKEGAGSQFDPDLVEEFLEII